jgi:REP element-mobilizing transposase RayT
MEIASAEPIAFHIVWTTYGTWLPGDARGWIHKKRSGIQEPDTERERESRDRMVQGAIVLTLEQRKIVEQTIDDHCRIRRWTLHAVRARTNHIHVVVSADRDSQTVMEQLKAWCSRRLSDAAGLEQKVGKNAGRRRWFTEGGDKEDIDTEEYLDNAIYYVNEGQ